jgi:hypothetical protein
MFSPGEICSKASVIEEKAASPHVRRGTFIAFALFSHFFARLRDQAEAYTATAQFGSPLIRITRMLSPPYRAYRAFHAYFLDD